MRKGSGFGRQLMAAALACSVFAASGAALGGNGKSSSHESNDVLTLAVYGDAPYGTTPTDTAEFVATPAFINAINGDPKVKLVLHVGDIHSGKQFCTQAYDQSVYDLWTHFNDPLVYTPGDNEWTDCNKIGEGGGAYNSSTMMIDYAVDNMNNPIDYAKGDPIANLDLIRSIFFSQPGYTLGAQKKKVFSQAANFDSADPADAKYVENVIWEQANVLFVTLNLPGGSNNDMDVWYGAPTETAAQKQERLERTGADLRWLNAAFDRASQDQVAGVVIALQADMWDPEKGAAHQTGYEAIVASIATHTHDFRKPVLLFNGDSHVYRSDNPLVQGAPCMTEPSVACGNDDWVQHPYYDVRNFHRVVVHGSTFPLEYLRLKIDAGDDGHDHGNHAQISTSDSFGPFSWQRVMP